jgi:hypothetical protein
MFCAVIIIMSQVFLVERKLKITRNNPDMNNCILGRTVINILTAYQNNGHFTFINKQKTKQKKKKQKKTAI